MKNVVCISPNGNQKVISIDIKNPKYCDLLGCKEVDGFSLMHFDPYGYKLAVIVDDFGIVNEFNRFVSNLSLREVHGDAILIDDDMDLSLEKIKELSNILSKDFSKIMERKNRKIPLKFFEDLLKD